MHQMPAVELGRDADGEVELAYRVIGAIGIGDRTDKIAAEADEDFRRAREHRLDRFDRMMDMIARRFETDHVADAIDIGPARSLVDALKSSVEGKSVSVRVDRVGRSVIQKKKK